MVFENLAGDLRIGRGRAVAVFAVAGKTNLFGNRLALSDIRFSWNLLRLSACRGHDKAKQHEHIFHVISHKIRTMNAAGRHVRIIILPRSLC
jgi:hypothetical protein